ncbi:MAG: FKBP-type peptidyl-prolyl cis-trans isomerase [Bacteroidia bacterium]|nr:FKBP-type peptidyl-prolyl cis-trans isomerase [Bacteroidia bacterium]
MFNKGYIFLLFAMLSMSLGCSKNSDQDLISMEDYIAENNITLTTSTSSGLGLLITYPGGANRPTISSQVTVKYTGYLTSGEVFDDGGGNPITFPLRNVILGWQEGIPYFGTGGKGTLFIPSNLAYGSRGTGSIPPNADLIFDIELIDFQ